MTSDEYTSGMIDAITQTCLWANEVYKTASEAWLADEGVPDVTHLSELRMGYLYAVDLVLKNLSDTYVLLEVQRMDESLGGSDV